MTLGLRAPVGAQGFLSTWYFSRYYLETSTIFDSKVSLLFISVFLFIHVPYLSWSLTLLQVFLYLFMLELLHILCLFSVLRLSVYTWRYFHSTYIRHRSVRVPAGSERYSASVQLRQDKTLKAIKSLKDFSYTKCNAICAPYSSTQQQNKNNDMEWNWHCINANV